ncbi:MAG: hypothetical protein AB1429_10210 [Pseudomonadota bacterium]
MTDQGSTAGWVAFVDKAGFDAAKTHFDGKPWKSNVVGAVDGFQSTMPRLRGALVRNGGVALE